MAKITPSKGLKTRLIHSGGLKDDAYKSFITPIYQSAAFYALEYKDVRYPRFNNLPNQQVLQNRLADIEEAGATLVTGSGMAAITTALLTVLKAGDHLIAQRCLYGNTFSLLDYFFPRFGIEVDYVDLKNAREEIPPLIKSNTKAVYAETISNPLVSVSDFGGVVEVCKKHDLYSLIDNTFASPVLFKPIPFGFDFSLHSATKYLNGHSDLTAGVLSCSEDLMEQTNFCGKTLGTNIDPHTAFLFERGLKTLSIRVEEQCRSAFQVATVLEKSPKIKKIYYPGLNSSADNEKANKYFGGLGGGMLAFIVEGGLAGAKKFVKSLKVISLSASLGGVESLVMVPSIVSHALVPEEERLKMGVEDGLVRLSVGVEEIKDLKADISEALENL